MATTYEDQWARMATQHEDQQARIAEEVDATFCMIFSDISLADLVRLIPWCISTAASPDVIPVHHLSEALATAVQPGADAPTPGSKDSQVLAPLSSPALRLHFLPSFPCQMFSTLVHHQ